MSTPSSKVHPSDEVPTARDDGRRGKAPEATAEGPVPEVRSGKGLRSFTLGTFVFRTEKRCSIEESCKGAVENMGDAKLCKPSVWNTFLASLVSTALVFVGLIVLGTSELGIQNFHKEIWSTLALRCIGWSFLFYIPIHAASVPFLRNFLLWSLQPGQHLKQAFAYQEGDQDPTKKAGLFPYVVHGCWLFIHASFICLPLGEEGHFGLVFIFALANLFMAPVGILSSTVLAPPTISKSYAFRMGPLTVIFPIFGFGIVVGSYIVLRRLIGPFLGFVLPLILSTYEILCTSVVVRVFTSEFVTKQEVREGYLGTNQGIVVSMAICNFHAMAEGARLTLLFVDNLESHDWDIMVPIVSGVLWNVSVRLGALDRFLHIITRGWRTPNNGSRLLRESAYCMGYPRFGAIFALFFARLCLGTPFSLHGPEIQVIGIVLLAEITEDVLSYLLYNIGCNIFPRPRLLTEEAVQELAGQRIKRNSKRKGSKESVGGTSKENVAVVPSPSKNSKDSKHSKDSKGKDELSTTSDRTLLKSTCWKLRVAYDFRFRIDAFEEMPFWAHLLPTAMAQFHTILAMVAFSGGLDFILGFCQKVDFFSYSSAVLWWPVVAFDQLCDR